jgi:hypothetical protein
MRDSWLSGLASSLCRRPLSCDETDDRNDDEYDEQHIGDVRRRARDSRYAQETRDQPDDEKSDGPVQHDRTSLDGNWERVLEAGPGTSTRFLTCGCELTSLPFDFWAISLQKETEGVAPAAVQSITGTVPTNGGGCK